MKLIKGDCYKEIKNIPDKSVDCVYTDIPYLFHVGGGDFIKHGRDALYIKALGPISNGIDYGILDEMVRVLKKINVFIWCSKDQIYDIMYYFNNIEGKNIFNNILVWCKTNPTPFANNTWLPDVEYCLYFREEGVQLNDGTKIKSKWYLSKTNTKDKDAYEHPTIKPLEFVKNHLLHATQPNDVVLDPFMGSGTTGVACKETGRDFIGIEINDDYYQIAVDRVNGISRKEKKKMEEGQLVLEIC